MFKKVFRASPLNQERLEDFEKIYHEYQKYVRQTAFYLVGVDDLDDIVQDVFLKLWNTNSPFDQRSSLKTWIYRITVNAAYDALRRQRRLLKRPLPSQFDVSDSDRFETDDVIRQGVLRLPERLRAAFVLYYQEDLSVSEVAEVLKIREGTVKSRLANGRKSMIDYLKRNGVRYE